MINRLVKVNNIDLYDLVFSSTFVIGDSQQARPFSRVIAVQKEGAFYKENMVKFEQFPIFDLQLQETLPEAQIDDRHYHRNTTIHVDSVRIIGISTSSMLQVGSLEYLDAESRVKHIRILRD
ncbi:spore germination protein GerPE [Thalassobacillus pellis]|uniref:spore germination protein GerPE n=1 Tax=Thalassobacillus pellis TaxID=748008 RepID=UPI00196131CD|nr:spore germination protein GerPE [Thalassobacillus pellis]MBM7554094.1 spore germination protein PE [Thalassobacillus pellis]